MSQSKVIGAAGASAATLPVTGSPVVALIAAGLVMVAAGVLMLRAGRFQRQAG